MVLIRSASAAEPTTHQHHQHQTQELHQAPRKPPRASAIDASWSDGLKFSSHDAKLGQYGDAQCLSASSESRVGLIRVLPDGTAPSVRPTVMPPSAPPAAAGGSKQRAAGARTAG